MSYVAEAYFNFIIRDVPLAVPVAFVEGVAPLPPLTAIPREKSRIIRGLVYIFGAVMPVIDLAPLLNTKPLRESQQLVVIGVEGAHYALLVDSVGTVTANTRLVAATHHPSVPSQGYIVHNKRRVHVLAMDRIIAQHVCN